MRSIDLSELYTELHALIETRRAECRSNLLIKEYPSTHNALQCSMFRTKTESVIRNRDVVKSECDGMQFMKRCLQALNSLDNTKWQRSFHQKQFHDHFLRASARVFFKTSPAGAFNRSYQHILRTYSWDHLSQEILVSTPRRFGKTISVSMFAAAMLYAAPSVEVSIYSTCKRISQKLLKNVYMFLSIIHETLNTPTYKVIRSNMEEIVMAGPEGNRDRRVINSYPSKVTPHAIVSFNLLQKFCNLIELNCSECLRRHHLTKSLKNLFP